MEKFISVNYHLTKKCNMFCKGCFARYEKATDNTNYISTLKEVVKYSDSNNIKKRKINFVGGEPTLIKKLPELVQFMSENGFITSIVTNGTFITEKYLNGFTVKPDWIGVSIDSFLTETNGLLGRFTKNNMNYDYFKICKTIKNNGIKLKINTMINKYNFNEIMAESILKISPNRWKVLQFLKVNGENEQFSDELAVSEKEFNLFKYNHSIVSTEVNSVFETTNDLTGSYLMISPDGCFFDNTNGLLSFSNPLRETGFENALKEINFSKQKLINRLGLYNW